MRRNPKNVEKRALFIQKAMNRRHKSETANMTADRLARELFLSPSTIWKDYAKKI